MRVLALDTATEACSAALLLGDDVQVREEEAGRRAAEVILGMIDELLAAAGVKLATLDAIAFGRGPGGFTGVRLAACVTQGLAFGAGLPVVPVSDLAALAQRALDEEPGISRVLAVGDARMHELYWGCFERSNKGAGTGLAAPVAPDEGLGEGGAERVGAPESVALPGSWRAAGMVPVMAVGRGLLAAPGLAERLSLAHRRESWLPRAREIARLAVPQVAAGELKAPEEALPLYLRDNVARGRTG